MSPTMKNSSIVRVIAGFSGVFPRYPGPPESGWLSISVAMTSPYPQATRRSRKQRQRLGVRRPYDGEVTVVERGDLRLAEHLGGGDHRRIDEAEGEVAVPIEQLARTPEPIERQVEQLE